MLRTRQSRLNLPTATKLPAQQSKRRRLFRSWMLLGLGLISVTSSNSGCTRQAYRAKTNNEVYYLIDQKIAESCEATAKPYRIEVDPRSRFFDPFNPDRPPMPEDDPQSHQFMSMVDQKRGYPLWEANGRTNTAENPEWLNFLPLTNAEYWYCPLEDAVRTALLHSPAYQQNIETLYLSALDVSSERFLLDSQFFGGYGVTATTDGPRRNQATTPNSSSTISGNLTSAGPRA